MLLLNKNKENMKQRKSRTLPELLEYQKEYRAERRKSGLATMTIWVNKEDVQTVKDFAKRLRLEKQLKQLKEAQQ